LSALTAVWIAARPAATAAAFAAFFATSLSAEGLLAGCFALLDALDAALAFLALAGDRLALLAAFALVFALAFDLDFAALRLAARRFVLFLLLVFLDAFLMTASPVHSYKASIEYFSHRRNRAALDTIGA
jgi:hypothetical protein